MTRDDDFIRLLLLEAEASPAPYLLAGMTMNPSDDELKRYMHAEWLSDAGFFQEIRSGVFRITNQGQDYLASIRDEGIWQDTKATASGMGGVALGVMKDIAISIVKQKLAEQFGLNI